MFHSGGEYEQIHIPLGDEYEIHIHLPFCIEGISRALGVL